MPDLYLHRRDGTHRTEVPNFHGSEIAEFSDAMAAHTADGHTHAPEGPDLTDPSHGPLIPVPPPAAQLALETAARLAERLNATSVAQVLDLAAQFQEWLEGRDVLRREDLEELRAQVADFVGAPYHEDPDTLARVMAALHPYDLDASAALERGRAVVELFQYATSDDRTEDEADVLVEAAGIQAAAFLADQPIPPLDVHWRPRTPAPGWFTTLGGVHDDDLAKEDR